MSASAAEAVIKLEAIERATDRRNKSPEIVQRLKKIGLYEVLWGSPAFTLRRQDVPPAQMTELLPSPKGPSPSPSGCWLDRILPATAASSSVSYS